MDTFLLAWGFLGLCLPGSGGTAETGKAPSGMRDVPVRPTFGFPGAVPVSRIDALRGNKFREGMSDRPRGAAVAARGSEGLVVRRGGDGAPPARSAELAAARLPAPGVGGPGDGAALESCVLVFWGSCGHGRGSGRDRPHVRHQHPSVRGPAPVAASGNFR